MDASLVVVGVCQRSCRTSGRIILGPFQRGRGPPVTHVQQVAAALFTRSVVMMAEPPAPSHQPLHTHNVAPPPPASSNTWTQKSRMGRAWHDMPMEYLRVLDKTPKFATFSSNDEDREHKRTFWRAIVSILRKRVKQLFEGEDWEKALAKCHESLWLEELHAVLELRCWGFTVNEIPQSHDGLYSLDISMLDDGVATLQEVDRSPLRGTNVIIKCKDGNRHVCRPQKGANAGVLLMSGDRSLANAEGPFHVEFHPQRFNQAIQHRALSSPAAKQLMEPFTGVRSGAQEKVLEERSATLPSALNNGQRNVVEASVKWEPDHPLLLWGPPGTGKTTVVAYLIWQFSQQSSARVLATSPSNTGADVLCRMLAKLGLPPEQMLRLNALGRSVTTLPEVLEPYSSYKLKDGKKVFQIPHLEELSNYPVVITTCTCAGHIMLAAGDRGGWFTHVVVDEAGEATEPETLIPLSLQKPGARTLLVGDHFQLGPLVFSLLATKIGRLDRSMLERTVHERFALLESAEVDDVKGISACEKHGLHFLTESFRSHPALMGLYSRLFYQDQLIHSSRPQQDVMLPFFKAYHNLDVPIIMHQIKGREQRDPDSPSIYNMEEVRVVEEYLNTILNSSVKISPDAMAVVSPYLKQLQAFEETFRGTSLENIECGTVEKFQGQERLVVVMSTVRCPAQQEMEPNEKNPRRSPIGFLRDPRRLNVAISRAVAGLIIVGDLQTLALHSPDWKALLDYGHEMNVVVGDVMPEDALPALDAESAFTALID